MKLDAAIVRAWGRYFAARNRGLPPEKAAVKAGFSASTAYRFERGDQGSQGLEAARILGVDKVGGNLVGVPLTPEAAKALDDFAYFRMRYMGRRSMPWQERAAVDAVEALGNTTERSYIVENAPPGGGKSTLFTHDIPCWLIARDRTIRIMIGSRTQRQASMYVTRIKKSLERDIPLRADADSLAAGVAFDAVATMQDDYGAFKPEGRSELWRAEGLTVRQTDGVSVDDKEPTVSAWGQDSGFLGGRFDLVLWDDLVDRRNTKTAESQDALREWWSTEAETRLEPGGVLILQGQRIAYNDLYRYCLDMINLDESLKYTHVVYPAHDDDNCQGHPELDDTSIKPRPWPDGCLLDPHRLPMRFLNTIKRNNPRVFEVQYQQRDGDLAGGLCEKAWIEGGVDSDGYNAVGCLDRTRPAGVVPAHLGGDRSWSFITVDPSPTEWWGIIWWLYDPETNTRSIIDSWRRRMNPEDFLSLDLDTYAYTGLLEDTRKRAGLLGVPITHVIFEANGWQKYLISQVHVQRWIDATGVVIVPHQTHLNKNDPKFGLESIGDLFRQGKVRIPYGDPTSRLTAQPLINELLRYPDSETTDMIMSVWFHKLGIENHYAPRTHGLYRTNTQPYLRKAERGMPSFAGAGRGR